MGIMRIALDDLPLQVLMSRDKRLAKVISYFGDIECSEHYDAYAFIIDEIVGQMLSNKVAAIMTDRLSTLCNNEVTAENISRLSFENLKSIGISSAKCQYIQNFTEACIDRRIDFDAFETMDDAEIVKQLTAIRGIGNWTAKMYLLFVLQRPNVLPYEDIAFLQGYKWLYKTSDVSVPSVKKKCKKWSPYASYAARYLYRAVDAGLIKSDFHLYKDL